MKCLFVLALAVLGVSWTSAQIPSFGACPEYQPIEKFNRNKFLGTWYEVERYFTVNEIASKCISTTYERRADGRIYVSNSFTNRFTGVQRIVSGQMTKPDKSSMGRFTVRYTSFPTNYNASLEVLDTDYTNYAVVISCSRFGSVGHAESAWLLARERVPSGPVLQAAYGVLDKYKISRTFFVQTDQSDCVTKAPPVEAVDPPVVTPKPSVEKPTEEPAPAPEEPIVEEIDDPNVAVVENLEDEESAKNALPFDDEIAVAIHAHPVRARRFRRRMVHVNA